MQANNGLHFICSLWCLMVGVPVWDQNPYSNSYVSRRVATHESSQPILCRSEFCRAVAMSYTCWNPFSHYITWDWNFAILFATAKALSASQSRVRTVMSLYKVCSFSDNWSTGALLGVWVPTTSYEIQITGMVPSATTHFSSVVMF